MPKDVVHKVVVAYIPVIHRGYLQLFDKFRDAGALYVLGEEFLLEEDYLRKELRAITPAQAAMLVRSLKIFPEVAVLGKADVKKLDDKGVRVILPDEDISHRIAEKYLSQTNVEFYPIFLRWDRRNVDVNQSTDDIPASSDAFDIEMMQLAAAEAQHSTDIWRRLGAVLVKDGKDLGKGANQAITTQNTAWVEGDPRAAFQRGVDIEKSTFMHAEAYVIAEAARSSTSLKGAAIYVTTFPCPVCAMLIAQSGIAKCYFAEGYAMLDGRRVLEAAGVKLRRVDIDMPEDERTWVRYPKPAKN